VDKLRRAGAIFLGKTNLHELAYGVTCVNPHYGPVRNPWDRERIAGGSSGGSAAALAAGIGFGSVGSDTGGSIRIPSALCGTVGLKPTYGRISRYGATPLSWSLDHIGPMTRSVKDAALLYDVMVGHDPKDPASLQREAEGVSQCLDEPHLSIKMGVPEDYFFERIDPEVEDLVRAAIDDLAGIGIECSEFRYEQSRHLSTCRNVIAFSEASSYHEKILRERPQDYGPGARELLRLGLTIQATEYLKAQRVRRRLVELLLEAFREVDFIVSPMTPAAAPKIVDEQFANGEDLRAGLLRLAGPLNAAGFPALALPCGFTRSGLPVGMQLVGRPFEEALLLQVGRAYEVAHSWRERHPC
jgi:aspartyl-tRNA(Asn)/glutamyl-tRNA(Gln) amidotransferase subunit A